MQNVKRTPSADIRVTYDYACKMSNARLRRASIIMQSQVKNFAPSKSFLMVQYILSHLRYFESPFVPYRKCWVRHVLKGQNKKFSRLWRLSNTIGGVSVCRHFT